jgi:putative membrane protein insertion efficiency factor
MLKTIVILCIPIFVKAQAPILQSDSSLSDRQPVAQEASYTGLHAVYKRFISSQDGEVCTFYPSCSNYAKQIIEKKGIWLGLFLAADRVCRCNGHHLDFYEYDAKSGKPIDQP